MQNNKKITTHTITTYRYFRLFCIAATAKTTNI